MRRPSKLLASEFRDLLAELESERLDVVLVPSRVRDVADRGGCIRVVVSRNPDWYRRLCATFPSSRRRQGDTRVRRANIRRILQRLSERRTSSSSYVTWLWRLAESRLPPF